MPLAKTSSSRAVGRVIKATGSIAAVSLAIALAGCTATGPDGAGTPPTQSSGTSQPAAPAEGTASPTPLAPPPEFFPEGTASENLPHFDYTIESTLRASREAGGKEIVDALAAAGFVKEAMEVTRDETTVGLVADTIQFSVRWDEEQCLIGQAGPKQGTFGYKTVVAELLGSGQCLVGATRPIDW